MYPHIYVFTILYYKYLLEVQNIVIFKIYIILIVNQILNIHSLINIY